MALMGLTLARLLSITVDLPCPRQGLSCTQAQEVLKNVPLNPRGRLGKRRLELAASPPSKRSEEIGSSLSKVIVISLSREAFGFPVYS